MTCRASTAVRRAEGVRAHQARGGHPHRALGRAAGGHRRRCPLDAPGLVGHSQPAVLAASFLQAHTTAAEDARRRAPTRSSGSDRRPSRRSQLWPVLARPPAAADAPPPVHEGDTTGAGATPRRMRTAQRLARRVCSQPHRLQLHKEKLDGPLPSIDRRSATRRGRVRLPQRFLDNPGMGSGRGRGRAPGRSGGAGREPSFGWSPSSSVARTSSPTGSSSTTRRMPSPSSARTPAWSRATESLSSQAPTEAHTSPTTPSSI